MCFSAPASFTASAVLGIVGAHAIRNNRHASQRLFAAIPLIFALQQFTEGLQWLVPHPSEASVWLGYAFLFFAFLLWPTYAPFAIHAMERNSKRRRWLRLLCYGGVLVTSILFFALLQYPLTVDPLNRGMCYNVVVPHYEFMMAAYAAVTILPCLLSSRPSVRGYGFALLVSCIVTMIAYQAAFTSVWCFFAAILSLLIYREVTRPQKA